jgi:cobalt-zinc-cadmium efflux system membrane fusion protein
MKPIFYLLAFAILFSACGHDQPAAEQQPVNINANVLTLTNDQLKNAGIVTGKIGEKEIISVLKLNGKIDVPPQNMVSISVPLGGYLKSTRLLPGAKVTRGDVIAVVEDQQYIQLQQDYLTAKAKISYLEHEYQRQKDLNQSKASSDKVFQQAEADYRSEMVLISSLAAKLELIGIPVRQLTPAKLSKSINIYSPINGFVSKVNVNIGKYVSPTEVVFELVNPTAIHLALQVYEKDLDKLYIGQKLVAYTNNEPAKKYLGTILLIGRDLSPDRIAEVHCHFAKEQNTLVPGTYMNAEIQVKSNMTMAIPTAAVVRYEGKQFLFLCKGPKTFEMMEVQTGDDDQGYTAIAMANLNQVKNEQFVVDGAYALLMLLKNKEM